MQARRACAPPRRSATGYRVRMLTRYGQSDEPTLDELRKGWQTSDPNTWVPRPACSLALGQRAPPPLQERGAGRQEARRHPSIAAPSPPQPLPAGLLWATMWAGPYAQAGSGGRL